MFELKPFENVPLDQTVTTKMWCDGNGNLGPCMCYDGPPSKGHWRGGRSIPLEEYVRMMVEKAVSETIEVCAKEIAALKYALTGGPDSLSGRHNATCKWATENVRALDPAPIMAKVLGGGK